MQTLARRISSIVRKMCTPGKTGVDIRKFEKERKPILGVEGKPVLAVNVHNVPVDLMGTPGEGRLRREPPKRIIAEMLEPLPEEFLAKIIKSVNACKARLKEDSNVGYILAPSRNHIIVTFQDEKEALGKVLEIFRSLQGRFPPKRIRDRF